MACFYQVQVAHSMSFWDHMVRYPWRFYPGRAPLRPLRNKLWSGRTWTGVWPARGVRSEKRRYHLQGMEMHRVKTEKWLWGRLFVKAQPGWIIGDASVTYQLRRLHRARSGTRACMQSLAPYGTHQTDTTRGFSILSFSGRYKGSISASRRT